MGSRKDTGGSVESQRSADAADAGGRASDPGAPLADAAGGPRAGAPGLGATPLGAAPPERTSRPRAAPAAGPRPGPSPTPAPSAAADRPSDPRSGRSPPPGASSSRARYVFDGVDYSLAVETIQNPPPPLTAPSGPCPPTQPRAASPVIQDWVRGWSPPPGYSSVEEEDERQDGGAKGARRRSGAGRRDGWEDGVELSVRIGRWRDRYVVGRASGSCAAHGRGGGGTERRPAPEQHHAPGMCLADRPPLSARHAPATDADPTTSGPALNSLNETAQGDASRLSTPVRMRAATPEPNMGPVEASQHPSDATASTQLERAPTPQGSGARIWVPVRLKFEGEEQTGPAGPSRPSGARPWSARAGAPAGGTAATAGRVTAEDDRSGSEGMDEEEFERAREADRAEDGYWAEEAKRLARARANMAATSAAASAGREAAVPAHAVGGTAHDRTKPAGAPPPAGAKPGIKSGFHPSPTSVLSRPRPPCNTGLWRDSLRGATDGEPQPRPLPRAPLVPTRPAPPPAESPPQEQDPPEGHPIPEPSPLPTASQPPAGPSHGRTGSVASLVDRFSRPAEPLTSPEAHATVLRRRPAPPPPLRAPASVDPAGSGGTHGGAGGDSQDARGSPAQLYAAARRALRTTPTDYSTLPASPAEVNSMLRRGSSIRRRPPPPPPPPRPPSLYVNGEGARMGRPGGREVGAVRADQEAREAAAFRRRSLPLAPSTPASRPSAPRRMPGGFGAVREEREGEAEGQARAPWEGEGEGQPVPGEGPWIDYARSPPPSPPPRASAEDGPQAGEGGDAVGASARHLAPLSPPGPVRMQSGGSSVVAPMSRSTSSDGSFGGPEALPSPPGPEPAPPLPLPGEANPGASPTAGRSEATGTDDRGAEAAAAPAAPGVDPAHRGTLTYTDLDALLHRLEGARDGEDYEDLSVLAELLGDARPSGAGSGALDALPVGRVEVLSRRTDRQGKVKQKLEVVGVRCNKCAVCLVQFRAEQLAAVLPCLHVFHTHCITSWLRRQHVCPLCREPVEQTA